MFAVPLPRRLRAGQPAESLWESPQTDCAVYRNTVYRRSLAVADVVAAALSIFVGVSLLGTEFQPWVVAAVPVVVLVCKIVGLYDRDENLIHHTTLDEAPALFQVATLYTLLLAVAQNVVVEKPLHPHQLVAVWVLLSVGMLAARHTARGLVRRTIPAERCLVLGDADAAAQIERKLKSCPTVNASVVGRATLESPADAIRAATPLLGNMADLPDTVLRNRIERVIIAPTSADAPDILDAIRLVKSLGVKVSVLPRLFEAVGSSVRFDDVEGLTLLGVPSYGLTTSSRLLKRGMDVTGALAGLIILAPVLTAIAAIVKLTSQGPVFFRQVRIGRHGQEFEMIKFRTMIRGAEDLKDDFDDLNEADGLFKIANDPRLTAAGRVLRRFSFDELPQLWNVLRGQMSLVGPRPLIPEEDRRVSGLQRRRLEVTPGMTGMWQVLGSARIPLHEMVKIDYLYAANWSLWVDLKILLRTALFVVDRRGL